MSSRNLKYLKARGSGGSLSDNNSMQEFSESGVCKSLLKKIDIHKIRQKIGENEDIFPSLVGEAYLYPFKPFKSTGKRGEDRGENV